ncbi:MAG: undecaprenyldiphospho-muramoylpentapeptide beta-N-acetylglucosaminyltransferase [Balneolaceae bacterium]|nr:MAG: undecaprenyldiphospho-muramoylpentapeptide beta-N-acetylglucosaminyltransferase [Balneolaceae bacterium]
MSPLRVLMAAGGTGGHVYPAIAIADAIGRLRPDTEIRFVGTRDRMEWKAVPRYGYKIKSIWISGLHRRFTIQNLLFPLKLVVSVIQSYFVLKTFKPDVVIACGGFASGPIGWAAAKLGIPLILQEQNSFPGVTNRMLGKHAALIFTAFENATSHFPEQKVQLTGNPVRSRLFITDRNDALKAFDFSPDSPVLLILGGSGGALALNEAMIKYLDELHNLCNLQIIWQSGEKYADGIRDRIRISNYPNLRLMEFIDDMPSAYGAADLVVTRAGAGTCSELMNIGQPAILVPSPNVAGDHQTKNAQSLVNAGAAELLIEEHLDQDFANTIKNLIQNRDKLVEMSNAMKSLARPDAADVIAKDILTYLKNLK